LSLRGLFDAPVVVEEPRVTPDRSEDPFAYAFRRADGRQIVTARVKSADRTVDIAVARDAAAAVEHVFRWQRDAVYAVQRTDAVAGGAASGTARIFEWRP